MRILIVSEVFWPEDFIINDLSREWKQMGHTIEVLTQYPSYPQSYVFDGYVNEGYSVEDWDGIKIHRFPFIEGYCNSKLKKFSNYLSFIHGGKKNAKKLGNNFDCIFVSQTGPLTVALPAVALSKKYGIPLYVWTFDIWPDVVYTYGVPKCSLTDVLLSCVIKKIYNSCTKIFVSSDRFKDTIGRYTTKEMVYAPNWLRPVEEKKSDLRLYTDKINFTFTGNISRYQNLVNTIKGFVKAGIPNAVFNIVGNGSYAEEIQALINDLGTEKVIMHGRKPYNQMNDLLLQSDILVLPLMPNDGIMKTEPLKLQSYLNAGKTVFGILKGSGKDIIDEGKIGICAEPDDIVDIARGFKDVITYAQDHSEEVKENAKKLMEGRFNKQRIVTLITNTISQNVK